MSEFDYRGPVKLVVFDWAGTTVDFGCFAPVAPFIQVYADSGIEVTMEQARGPMGIHKKDHIRALGELPEVAKQWQLIHKRPFVEDDVDSLYQRLLQPEVSKAIAEASGLISGIVEAADRLRERGVKIGATTGYFRQAAEAVVERARSEGFAPDVSLCVDDVPAGRPAPWGMFSIMQQLDVYPPTAVVKIGDTVHDIGEGRCAGTWTVGVTRTGNDVGLTEAELAKLSDEERKKCIDHAGKKLLDAGAHWVVETAAEIPELLDEIEKRIADGIRP